jgi:LPS sulfotransferase NodH
MEIPEKRADRSEHVRPLVSLIFLVIGRTKRLEEALEAARTQTYTPLEIILVDLNGSRNIDALTQHDHTIRVLPTMQHDHAAAQQMAVQQSQGEYILFLSPEDVLHPASVQLGVDALEADPQRAVAGCIIGAQARSSQPAAPWNYALLQHGAQMPPAAVFCRAAAENLHAINPALRLAEDDQFFGRLIQQHTVSCVVLPGDEPASNTTNTPGTLQRGATLLRLAWQYTRWAVLLRRGRLAWHRFKHTGASMRLLIGLRHMLMGSKLPASFYASYYRILGYRYRKGRGVRLQKPAQPIAPQQPLPECYYVVCASPRTGSNLLNELLKHSGVAGKPLELFNMRNHNFPWPWWNHPKAVERLHHHCARFTTPNQVCGIKILCEQWINLRVRLASQPCYQGRPPHDVFDEILHHPRYIWIRRHDKLRQALSLWRALQNEAWVSHARPGGRPAFDAEAIDWLVQHLHHEEEQWQQFFDQLGITPLTIIYEDLVADRAGTLRQVLAYLDLPLSAVPSIQETRNQQQSDATTEEWLLMYQEYQQTRSIAPTI